MFLSCLLIFVKADGRLWANDFRRWPAVTSECHSPCPLSPPLMVPSRPPFPVHGALTGGTAVVVEDSVVSAPCAAHVLFPAHGGNIHSFSAITHTAVLDVLAPPYNPALGRQCNYFRFSPSPPLSPPGTPLLSSSSSRIWERVSGNVRGKRGLFFPSWTHVVFERCVQGLGGRKGWRWGS